MKALFVVKDRIDIDEVYRQMVILHGSSVFVDPDKCGKDGICIVYGTEILNLKDWDVYRDVEPDKKYATVIDHGGMCIDPEMGAVEDITEWSLEEKGKVQDRILEAKKEKKEPKEITCSNCKTVFKARIDCPSCGHRMKQKTEALEFYEADLKEVKVKKTDKQRIWNDCLYTAKYRGAKVGAAAHIYKRKVGVWPRGLDNMPKGSGWKQLASEFIK